MAAAMNGMALHGGIIPYRGTFLVFSDYCRPAIRLAALMGMRVIHVMTHDFDRARRGRADASAGRASGGAARDSEPARVPPGRRGRDGRVLAARAREQGPPERAGADAAEPAAAAQRFPRQKPLRRRRLRDRACRGQGAGVDFSPPARKSPSRSRRKKLLAAKGVAARVVSVPCFELLAEAPEAKRRAIIGDAKVRIGVEAAMRQGWDAVIGSDGVFVGMTSFGASAPVQGALQALRHYRRGGGRGGVKQTRPRITI